MKNVKMPNVTMPLSLNYLEELIESLKDPEKEAGYLNAVLCRTALARPRRCCQGSEEEESSLALKRSSLLAIAPIECCQSTAVLKFIAW